MTHEERRVRPEHHVVHDYANLVSSGKLVTERVSNDALSRIGGANSHVWHAFYMNGRKMFEFFRYPPLDKYLRASQFLTTDVAFPFQNWNKGVQAFMETHMLHVGAGRLTNEVVMTGSDDKLYLADFEEAWRLLMGNLRTEHKAAFRDEIDYRLTTSPFGFCGSLGKEFIT